MPRRGSGSLAFVFINTWNILVRAAVLYGRHFLTYIGIFAPIIVIDEISLLCSIPPAGVNTITKTAAITNFVGSLVACIGLCIVISAASWAISRNFFGEHFSIKSAYSQVFRRFPRLIWTYIIVGIVAGVLLIPLMYFRHPFNEHANSMDRFLYYFLISMPDMISIPLLYFSIIISMSEKKYAFNALKRFVKIFLSSPGEFLFLLILFFPLKVVLRHYLFMLIYKIFWKDWVLPTIWIIAYSRLFHLLIEPFMLICFVLLYYYVRMRKEHISLKTLAQGLRYGAGPGRKDTTVSINLPDYPNLC